MKKAERHQKRTVIIMLLNCFYRRHKMHIASEALALSHSATNFFRDFQHPAANTTGLSEEVCIKERFFQLSNVAQRTVAVIKKIWWYVVNNFFGPLQLLLIVHRPVKDNSSIKCKHLKAAQFTIHQLKYLAEHSMLADETF